MFLQFALCLGACSKAADQPPPKPTSAPVAAPTVVASTTGGSTASGAKAGATKAGATKAGASTAAVSKTSASTPAATQPKAAGRAGQKLATLAVGSRCGVTRYTVLTDLGIGDLQVGRTTASVKRSCFVVRDAVEPMEGIPQRVLRVLISGDTVRATVLDDLIWRISITSPQFVTRDGLRVGTPLSRVVTQKGVTLTEGEDGLYTLLSSHCGLSFRFAFPSRAPPGKEWTPGLLERFHGDAVVNKIFVTRCIR